MTIFVTFDRADWSDKPTCRLARLAPPITVKEGQQVRVLLIDDDPSVREVVYYLLASFGYQCHTAADGRSGLAEFAEGDWDLVLTDLEMPAMDGWQVIEAIRQRAPTVPIVLITAYASPDVMRRASEWAVPVIAKPFRLETFKAAIVETLYRKPA